MAPGDTTVGRTPSYARNARLIPSYQQSARNTSRRLGGCCWQTVAGHFAAGNNRRAKPWNGALALATVSKAAGDLRECSVPVPSQVFVRCFPGSATGNSGGETFRSQDHDVASDACFAADG